mgnify:CR=1 FL=1
MDKRRKKYFGCLANEGLQELTSEQRLKLFKKKNKNTLRNFLEDL